MLTAGLALLRDEFPMRARVAVLGALAMASFLAVALQAPDIIREIRVAGASVATMSRVSQGPTGNLLRANMFPFGDDNVRAVPGLT